MAPRPMTARSAAVQMLTAIMEEGKLLSETLEIASPLEGADRARAQRLAIETLRAMPRVDRILKPYISKTPPLFVQNILRIATNELCRDGAAHGVVNEAVNLTAAQRKAGHLKGMVNAVLRKVARNDVEKWDTFSVPTMPKWLRKPLLAAYGNAAMHRIENVQFKNPPLDLTLKNPSDAAIWAERLGGTVMPSGSVRLAEYGQVTALEGYEAGEWWVQDAAAAMPAQLLNVQAGEKVLDLCAAPGGKTLQLASTGAEVTALDVSDKRMERVSENLARTGLNAAVVVDDGLKHQGSYDAILLDAPCSATGTLRRHPDLPYAKDGSEFFGLFQIQEKLLDHAWSLLKSGGRMVFCTCSLLPDEGEAQIDSALERHKDMRVVAPEDVEWIEPDWRSSEGGLRLRPDFWADQGGMDGFYIAVLQKA